MLHHVCVTKEITTTDLHRMFTPGKTVYLSTLLFLNENENEFDLNTNEIDFKIFRLFIDFFPFLPFQPLPPMLSRYLLCVVVM